MPTTLLCPPRNYESQSFMDEDAQEVPSLDESAHSWLRVGASKVQPVECKRASCSGSSSHMTPTL